MKYLRDLWYYLSTRKAKKIYCIFTVYMVIGMILTSIVYSVVGKREEYPKEIRKAYCYWQPKRGFSNIYWVIEYLPRKASCWLWLDYEEKNNES